MTTFEMICLMQEQLGEEFETIEIEDFDVIDDFAQSQGYKFNQELDFYEYAGSKVIEIETYLKSIVVEVNGVSYSKLDVVIANEWNNLPYEVFGMYDIDTNNLKKVRELIFVEHEEFYDAILLDWAKQNNFSFGNN